MGCGGSNAGAVAAAAMPAPFFEKDGNEEVNVIYVTEQTSIPETPAVDIYEYFSLEERRRGGLLNVTWTLTSMDADVYESSDVVSL